MRATSHIIVVLKGFIAFGPLTKTLLTFGYTVPYMHRIFDVAIYNSSLHYIIVLRRAKPVLGLYSVALENRSAWPVWISGHDAIIKGVTST